MINETLEADRAYRKDMNEAYERGYAQGKVDAEPKRGCWKYNGKIGTFKIFTCDQCGWNSEAEFNFCPNCGAKMGKD